MLAGPRAIGGCGRAAPSIRTNRAQLPGSSEPRRSFAWAESEGRSRAPAMLYNAGPVGAIGDYEVRFHLQLQRQRFAAGIERRHREIGGRDETRAFPPQSPR